MGRGLTLLETQQWAGTLTALFAFAACAVSGELGPALVMIFLLAALAAPAFAGRLHGHAQWPWTALLAGALVIFGGQVVAGQLDIVLAAARFAALLCIHRLWHRRGERDEMLLLLLSLLLVCGGAALAAELSFGFAFLAFAVSGTWAMALTHLRFAIEAGRGPQGSAALLSSRRVATPAMLGGLAALSLVGIAGAAVVFFAFPRVTIGGWRRATRQTPVAGLGDGIDLSRQGTIADDPRVVLRVRMEPPPEGEPRDLSMHWRARALSRWTGRGWRSDAGGIFPARRLPQPPALWAPRSVLGADVEVVGQFADGVILTPEGWPLSVDFRRPGSSRMPPQRLYRNAAGDLFYQPVEESDLRYFVSVDRREPDLAALRGRARRYPAQVAGDLAVPEGLDPRVRALAERLGAGKDPADAAAEIERWLSASLRYTRELPGEVADPIAAFLFERRAGHCELFSSAMVLMLRSLGIPARNVSGYYGGRRTDAGYYAVRAGDAHSWVEVYFPGVGYARFDPTPPSARGSVQEGAWARMVLLWDALQQRWRAYIVEYDLLSQGRALRRIGQLLSETGRRLSGTGGAPGYSRAGVALAAGAVTALAVFALTRRRRWRSRHGPGRRALTGDQRQAVRLWRAARSRVRRAGFEVPAGKTASELAQALPLIGEIASLYGAARWGGAELPAAEARAALGRLDGALRDRVAPRVAA